MKLFERWECLTSYKPFDFIGDPDHDSDPRIFNGIFTTVG